MCPVRGLPQAGEDPVRVGIVGVLRQDVPKRVLGRIQLTDEHLAIGVVDPIHDVIGFRVCGLFEPGERLFILANQRVHGTDQVVHDGFTVLVLDGFSQR